MRIAIVGSHATGKSTLVTELTRRLPTYVAVDEPYYTLTSSGHVFSDPPTFADFEMLCEASMATLAAHDSSHVVFDRSPADYLAYLVALDSHADLVEHVAATGAALESIDLVVYVPIEQPDLVASPELPRLRRKVDAVLREIFVDQTWGWAFPCLDVHGTPAQRAAQVVHHLGR